MNHQKVYDAIIQNAKSKSRKKLKKCDINYIYYEKHHILPKCLGGTNDEDNLVLLTAREHFICHKLLTYIYAGNRKIACALHKMTYGNSNKHIKTSRDYEYVIHLMKNTPISIKTKEKMSVNSGWKNSYTRKFMKKARIKNSYKYKTPEFRHKISKLTSGENNPMFGKHHSCESIQKIKEHLDVNGKNNPMFGKHHSKESREKMSNSQKNRTKIECPICKKLVDPGNFSKWHGEKCKFN
jgi:hypothetical protein